MYGSFAFFKFAAKAALHCVGFGMAGEFVGEVLPDMAREFYLRWAKNRSPEEVRAEVEAIARIGDEESHQLAAQAVAEVAPMQPEALKLSLMTYLAYLPAAVRQTQRRPSDPSGRSISPSLMVSRPADVLAFLPPRLARFEKGQRAPGFPDWQLEELLGIGGFGEVWKAVNPHLPSEPPVALKFCLDQATARMLRNEVALLDRVRRQGRHAGIVALLDTALSSEPPCLKYEFVSGGDLTGLIQDWHHQDRATIPTLAVGMIRRLAEIIAFAHRLTPPIVHRDLKPSNILLEGSPVSPKVADFGIGAIVTAQGGGTLANGSLASRMPTALRGSCTPLYASPQQVRGDDPHPRDDVYALGVIWYQMLTGLLTEQPGTDWREELASRAIAPPIVVLLARCLAVREERRLPDAIALVGELDRLEGRPPSRSLGNFPHQAAEGPLDDPGELPLLDTDDPHDLAARVQDTLLRAQRTLARAVDMAQKQHDYLQAVLLLEGLPEPFRDSGLLDLYRERRDRIAQLRQSIQEDVLANRFAGLRDRIEELLELTPHDPEMGRLHETVPWEPGKKVTNAIGMALILLPAGSFQMGSPANERGRHVNEGPVHNVEITRPFYLGKYPVTQEQYQRVMGIAPSHFRKVAGCDTRTFPVENVSYLEALEFCQKLSGLPEERRRGRSYRLPTEAEWEYACRGGKTTPFTWGSSISSREANFDGLHPYGNAATGDYIQRPSPVGSFAENDFGLCDLHGNVWEWCADWYSERYYRESPRRDPQGPEHGGARVLRGGSWQNHGRLLRAANRDWVGPRYRGFTIGFRVVLEVGSATTTAEPTG